MKNLIILITGIFVFSGSHAQTNFVWEKSGTVTKSKSQMYSDTKMYIAKTWTSPKNEMRNDDKDGGVIFYKAVTTMKVPYKLGQCVYVYVYNLTFRIQDHRYKIMLDNVYCESAYTSGRKGSPITKINPFEGDNCPETGTFKNPGLPKGEVIPMMTSFKKQLQSFVDGYEQCIKAPVSSESK